MAIFGPKGKQKADWLIVGLGNPGKEYANTRHNAGWKAVDALAAQLGARYWKSSCDALVASVKRDELTLVLAKPQTYMNLSGQAVKGLVKTYGTPLDHVIVIHDELDLEPGVVKVKVGGGHAGHNGLRSIHEKLGSGDYLRVRVGIGRPEGRKPAADYVLQEPKGDDLEAFRADCARAADAALAVVDKGATVAQNEFN